MQPFTKGPEQHYLLKCLKETFEKVSLLTFVSQKGDFMSNRRTSLILRRLENRGNFTLQQV